MSDPSDRYYHPRRIRAAFAGASLALLASMVWWIKIEYDRPWRRIQDQFTRQQAALAYCDLAVARSGGRQQEIAITAKRYEDLSNTSRQRLFNLPLFDFLAPRDAPGKHAIRQLILPDVRRDLAFVQTETTDRCTTCHLAMGDPVLTSANIARRLEQAIPILGAQLEAQGEPPLTLPTIPGRADLSPGRVAAGWWTLTVDQQTSFLDELTRRINRALATRGEPPLVFASPLAAHPHPQLYLTPNSPHPIAKMGCTVCHEGNGEETDFVLAAHTAPDQATEQKWKQTYYTRRAGLVPEHTFESARQGWDRPMLPLKYTQANCARCHRQVADLAMHDHEPTATRLDEGRYLFTSLGCANCHPQQSAAGARRVGPDLTYVGSKLARAFLHNWLWMPQGYRPSTWMPASLQQENGNSGPSLRGRTEAVAMSEYLLAFSQPYQPLSPPAELLAPLGEESIPAADAAAARGRQLFDTLGCLACHAALEHRRLDETGSAGETVGQTWIAQSLFEQAALATRSDDEYETIYKRACQQAGQMSHAQRIEYALRHFHTERYTFLHPDAPRGPVFSRFAPELSNVRTKFGDYQRAVVWLYDWLTNPRHYSSDTKMPSMRLRRQRESYSASNTGRQQLSSTDEALDLAIYLSRLQPQDICATQAFDADAKDAETIEATRDVLLGELLRMQDPATDVEAVLDDRAGELTSRLMTPFATFADADRIQARLVQIDLPRKRWLLLGQQTLGHYGCHGCHRIPGFEQAAPIGPDLTNWAEKDFSQLDFGLFRPAARARRDADPLYAHLYPADRDDLIRLAHGNPPIAIAETRPDFAWHKLRNPRIWDRGRSKPAYEGLRMPNFFLSDEEADSLVTYLLSLKPARVTRAVSIDYQNTPTGRVARGRDLARELNCLGCHELDKNVPLIRQYYWRYQGGQYILDEANAPPWLRTEAARVRPESMLAYLSDVPSIRPWLQARMPSFHLTGEQAAGLVDYLAGLQQRESQWLAHRLARIDERERRPVPEQTWFQDTELGVHAAALRRYARANRLVLPHLLDAAQTDPGVFAATHDVILEQARFFRDLLEVSYPFEVPASTPSTPALIADGQVLFYELNCLQCHSFGGTTASGANAYPTAPDLQRTHERLRPAWVSRWLTRPRRILPGTRMPDFFGSDFASPFADYPTEDRERLAARLSDPGLLDKPAAQVQALIAFLYDASRNRRQVTNVQPP